MARYYVDPEPSRREAKAEAEQRTTNQIISNECWHQYVDGYDQAARHKKAGAEDIASKCEFTFIDDDGAVHRLRQLFDLGVDDAIAGKPRKEHAEVKRLL